MLKTRLNALILFATLISMPCLSGVAYAHDHDGWDKSGSGATCAHQHFSEEKMKLLHQTMAQLQESRKKIFAQMHKLHEERHTILAAETFDKTAFLSVTARLQKLHEHMEKNRMQAFAAIADQFTAEERQHLAHMFIHHRHRGWHRARWHHGKGHHGKHHQHEGRADGTDDTDHAGQTTDQKDTDQKD